MKKILFVLVLATLIFWVPYLFAVVEENIRSIIEGRIVVP